VAIHPAYAVVNELSTTTPAARRERTLLERAIVRRPSVMHTLTRLTLAIPLRRLRDRIFVYGHVRSYAAFNRSDWELWVTVVDPEEYLFIAYDAESGLPDMGQERRGVAGNVQAHQVLRDAFPDLRLEIDGVLVLDRNRIVSLVHYVGSGGRSGLPIDQQGAVLAEFRDGRIVRHTHWIDRLAAFEALGIADSVDPRYLPQPRPRSGASRGRRASARP
jgi:ketosteroid isomerase-like protein